MSVYNDVIMSIIDLIDETKPYAEVKIGSNIPKNGICILPSATSTNTFLDKNTLVDWNISLNAKHSDQMIVFEMLNKIHTHLTRKIEYPQKENFQIYAIETASAPRLIGRENEEQWIYGSILRIKFYMRGE